MEKKLQTQKRLPLQGSRSLAALNNSTNAGLYLTKKKKCALFDSMVASVINYALKFWGLSRK